MTYRLKLVCLHDGSRIPDAARVAVEELADVRWVTEEELAPALSGADALYVGNDMHRDIWGAREAGMQTVMFNSDQGTKEHLGCVPDHTIHDYRELLELLDLRP